MDRFNRTQMHSQSHRRVTRKHSASVSTVAWMAAAVMFAFMRAFVRAWAFPPFAVMAAAATLVLVLLRQVRGTSIPVPFSLSLSVPLAGLAGGTRAAARPFPFVTVSAVLVQIVWALLGLQVWQEGRRRAVVGMSPWRWAAGVRAAPGARAVGAWVTVPVIVTRGKAAIEYRHKTSYSHHTAAHYKWYLLSSGRARSGPGSRSGTRTTCTPAVPT